MYKSSNDSMLPSEYNPTVRFSHVGGAYNLVEAVFIQFYEPNKNPNRVLFFGEDLKDLGIDKMDKWKDTERRSGTSNDIMNHILIAYPESDISVQYEIVHRKVIDVHNPWNYFGVFPQFKEETELIITHNDALDRGRDKLEEDPGKILGSIRVTPNSFQKRIITEKRDTTIIDVLGSVGGVASVLFTVYTILFGARPLRPWGIIQKSTIIQHQPKKKAKQLKHYFDIQAVQGIPLVTPVHSRYSALYNRNVRNNGELERTNDNQSPLPQPNEQKIDDMSDFQRRLEQLEGRNQILELVLKAYYVDDEIFHQLKQARETPDIIPKTDDLESESDSQVTCCNSNINRLRNA
jgi:hypothetical protein